MRILNVWWNLVVSVAIVVAFASTARGAEIRVDDSSSANGPGNTWGNAYRYLRDAVSAAASGDTLLVAQGL